MNTNQEIRLAVSRFIRYVKEFGWSIEESFEIAYDSVYDLIEKENFLNRCQEACLEMNLSIKN